MISFGLRKREEKHVFEAGDSLRVSARHVVRLAHRPLLARGALDRDGGVAEGDFVVDTLLVSGLGRSGVFHWRLPCVGLALGVCRRSQMPG